MNDWSCLIRSLHRPNFLSSVDIRHALTLPSTAMAVPMDADSALLAIQLLNDDVAGIQSALKGKHRDDEPDPQEFPWQAFLTELETYEQIASDEKMSLSIATAIAKDRDIIAEEVRQQNQAAQDRNYAVSLCGDDPQDRASLRSATPSIAPTEDVDDEYLAKLFANYVSLEEATNILRPGTADSGAPGSAGGALNHGARNAPTRQCIACQEETSLFDVAKVPCGHEYCRECLDSLFSTAAKDENFFPPRCCRQRIHLHTARMFLTAKTATNFVKMEREFSTPDRTYCSRPACSSWIPPERIQAETATCPVCLETTCTICRNHGHEGDCPFDEALRDTERLASELGWQRCYQCRRFVELEFGCNHMV